VRSKLLRTLGLAAYGCGVLALFGLSAYLAFSLFVRSGVTRTPDVGGLAPAEAAALLTEQGLRLAEVEAAGRYSEAVPAGKIVEQRPRAGSLVKRGSHVEAVLSLGPQRLTVPDLSGQAVPSAQVALAAAGLSLGDTVRIYSAHTEPGTVVEQQPQAGAQVAKATPVDLLVAQGASTEVYLMPDLVYRHYEEVRRFFEQRGFRLGSVRFEPYEGAAEGVILRQFPLAGHPLSRGDAISLVVATAESAPV